MGLVDVFATLPRPSVAGAYSVGPEIGRCRVGRSFDGHPALLVSLSLLNGAHLGRRLTNFAYYPPAPVQIRNGELTTNDDLAIVECCTTERRLAKYFFRIAADVLAPEAAAGEEARFERAIDAVITLFKAIQRPASQTVQGLWAELAVILFAHSSEEALKSWRSVPNSLHDFVNGRSRLEVKSSTRGMREHHFSLDQLRLSDDGLVLVASVLLTEAGGGISISDLVTLIRQRLLTDESKRRLETIVADSLGASLTDGDDHLFDIDEARASVLLYRATDIPTCAVPLPPEVKKVTFTVDISAVAPTPLAEARSISPEFRDLLPALPSQ